MEEGGINMADIGRQRVRIARSETFPRTILMANPDATSSLNPGTSQGEDPGPSATNGIEVVVSSSEICEATSSLNPGTSLGEDPSPSPTNGRERTSEEKSALCGPLLQAAINGYWPDAKAFLEKNKDCVGVPITKEQGTALHVAVIAQRITFVKELLKWMRGQDDLMILKNKYGSTALHCAARSGNVRIAKQLVKFKPELLWMPDNNGDVPLNVAAYIGRHANMVSYLLPRTELEKLTDNNRVELFEYTIYKELYDIALRILEIDPRIPNIDIDPETKCGWSVLEILASKPFAIGSESRLSFWKSLLKYSWFKGICNKALMKTSARQLVQRLLEMVESPEKHSSNLAHSGMIMMVFEAAEVGNAEFLIILSRFYPELLWKQNENKMSIFHIAIKYRHENVFNLIYEIDAINLVASTTLNNNDNRLHLAGELAPQDRLNIVSGAALQMQRELLWFKEIEKIVPPSYVNKVNLNLKTPKQIFIDKHKELQKQGEKWMKDTANYCMVVATIIATVIFAATFTVPGGINQVTGTPIFLRRTWFLVFFISNAIALCCSSTSIVIFLSILTSRFTEEDFLKSLPSKLAFGLATLFVSMAGMMVAFSATCFLVYSTVRAWDPIVVISSASFPVILFFVLHRKLWVDTFLSTCTSRFLFRPCKQRLFQRNVPIGELFRRKFEMKENCRRFTGC